MKEIGDLGEQLIGRWLELQGYSILKRNWRCRWGEVDLIAREKSSDTIAFVEVKTRGDRNWDADGLLAVNDQKQQKIIQTAALFLAQYPELADLPCRFDLALVSYQLLPNHSKTATNFSAEIAQIPKLAIAESITLGSYLLTVRSYLAAAFD
ncbi:MAG: YraN family protein [Cyanobacteria bacterium J06623_7]